MVRGGLYHRPKFTRELVRTYVPGGFWTPFGDWWGIQLFKGILSVRN